jgi:predicted ATPase
MGTNKELFKTLDAERARFYLCDFHVHGPASRDVIDGERFDALSDEEKGRLAPGKNLSGDLAEYEVQVIDNNIFPVEDYLGQLARRRDSVLKSFQAREGDNWGVIAITDHNVCSYACRLSTYAWENRNSCRLIVLPGIELDVTFPVPETTMTTSAHVLLVFAPTTIDRNIYSAIRDASTQDWDFGRPLEVTSLPTFVRNVRSHRDFPAVAIAAHVDTGKGIQARTVSVLGESFRAAEAEFARLAGELENLVRNNTPDTPPTREMAEVKQSIEGVTKEIGNESAIPLQVLELIGHCGFDGLQVHTESAGRHYRRLHRFEREIGRAVPLVCSDAHRVDDVFVCKNAEVPFIKLSALCTTRSPEDVFHEIRTRGIRYGETRLAVRTPGEVTCWISGIEITPDHPNAKTFWPFSGTGSKSFILPLSRNLNCLIGGRGSGKSAAIEALSFAAQPKFLEDRDHGAFVNDFRKRAEATLSGCNVRLCWTCLDKQGEYLPKRAIFATRYFNDSGRRPPISYSDIENREIPSVSLPVEIFRLREVEDLVENPERLRDLFDNLCGENVAARTARIASHVEQLRGQRKRVVEIAREICRLTMEGSPLRAYVYRQLLYDGVNSEDVRAKYERLDGAAIADEVAHTAQEDWKMLCDGFALEEKKKQVEQFFVQVEDTATDADSNLLPFCSPLERFIQAPADGEEASKSLKDRVIGAVTQLDAELSTVTHATVDAGKATHDAVKAEREQLAGEGLPVGGRERESKKVEFDEAAQALESYKKQVALWDQEMQVRNATFAELEAECKARTEDRKRRAAEITAKLRQELDPEVLVIEIDAQPMADKRGLADWINGHLYPANTRSKEVRTAALIEDGMMPETLRNALLSKRAFPCVVRATVAKGEIDEKTAALFVDHCWGMRRIPPEKQQPEVLPEQWASLPEEIRNGLLCFPTVPDTDGKLDEKRLNAVLEIDEIVFNDLPEIRLMDRPREMTAARPLQELSHGQRCSAILPILLLNGTCPLVIDQPEDNLDNRLIREVVVKILASIKLKRQVIIATHNPNLPVLGDVEQAVVLRAVEDKKCLLQVTGNLDEPNVVRLITEVMEGGREAFQYRHSLYQPYWEGPVDVSDQASGS